MDSTIGVSPKRYRYTGKERDEETGLDSMGVRYYAGWLGRWTSADPIGIGDGVNRFGYVSGNPVGMRDPSGTKSTSASSSDPTSSNVDFSDDPLVVNGDVPVRSAPKTAATEGALGLAQHGSYLSAALGGALDDVAPAAAEAEPPPSIPASTEPAPVKLPVVTPDSQLARIVETTQQRRADSYDAARAVEKRVTNNPAAQLVGALIPGIGNFIADEFDRYHNPDVVTAVDPESGEVIGVAVKPQDSFDYTKFGDERALGRALAVRNVDLLSSRLKGPAKVKSGDLDAAAQARRRHPHGADRVPGNGVQFGSRVSFTEDAVAKLLAESRAVGKGGKLTLGQRSLQKKINRAGNKFGLKGGVPTQKQVEEQISAILRSPSVGIQTMRPSSALPHGGFKVRASHPESPGLLLDPQMHFAGFAN